MRSLGLPPWAPYAKAILCRTITGMTARQFRWIFVGLLLFEWTATGVSGPSTIGAAAEWSSSDGYRFAAGTSPWALAAALGIAGLYILLMCANFGHTDTPVVGVIRRLAALWLDLMLAMVILAPTIGIFPLLLEWARTGTFAWSVERTTPVATDIPVTMLSTLMGLPVLLFYFAVPVFRRRPSPGACIVGYEVLPDSGKSPTMKTALLRTIIGSVMVWAEPFIGRDRKKGQLWVDRNFGTRATLLR